MKNKFTKEQKYYSERKDKYYKGKLIMFVKKKALVEFQKTEKRCSTKIYQRTTKTLWCAIKMKRFYHRDIWECFRRG